MRFAMLRCFSLDAFVFISTNFVAEKKTLYPVARVCVIVVCGLVFLVNSENLVFICCCGKSETRDEEQEDMV